MRGIVVRAAAIAAGIGCLLGAAALLAGAAAGRTTAGPRLALMPLPKEALGAAAALLPVDERSGGETNAEAAADASGHVTATGLRRLGRVRGYRLGYSDASGHALASRRGLLEVETGVDLYRSPAAARAGLAFWRSDERNVAGLRAAGIAGSVSLYHPKGLGSGSFGASGVLRVEGMPAIRGVDVDFVRGRLVASVTVASADRRNHRAYAVALARHLRARIQAVLRGRIKGPLVELPPRRHAVNLRTLALKRLDLGDGVIRRQEYGQKRDGRPRTDFVREMSPAGVFVFLHERVDLFDSTLDARFGYALLAKAITSKALRQAAPRQAALRRVHFAYQATPVPVPGMADVRAVRAVITLRGLGGGAQVIEGIILMRVGRTTEFIVVASPTTVPLTEDAIRGLVATAARRARAGLSE